MRRSQSVNHISTEATIPGLQCSMFNIPLLLDLQLSVFAEASLVGLSPSLERHEAWTRQLTEVFFSLNLREVSLPFVTSQRSGMSFCLHTLKSRATRGRAGWNFPHKNGVNSIFFQQCTITIPLVLQNVM